MKFFLFSLLTLFSLELYSQWNACTSLNTPISVARGVQYEPKIIRDNNNGVYIAWTQELGSIDIYCQRVNSNGEPLWQLNGIPVCENPSLQYAPQIFPDTEGGVIILWLDRRNTFMDYSVYGQRLDKDGNKLWSDEGLFICEAHSVRNASTTYFKALQDRNGNIIITNSGTSFYVEYGTIKAYKIDIDGNHLWEDGIIVGGNIYWDNYDLCLNSNNEIGFIWSQNLHYPSEYNYDVNIYFQILDSLGNKKWPEKKCLLDYDESLFNPLISSDDQGGFYIHFSQVGQSHLQRFNAEGEIIWNNHLTFEIADDECNLINTNNGVFLRIKKKIYIIDFLGNMKSMNFLSNDEYTNTLSNFQYNKDNYNGLYMAWNKLSYDDIVLQHIDQNGILRWDTDQIRITTRKITNEYLSDLEVDEQNNALVVWSDARIYGDKDIYAQKVLESGKIDGSVKFAGQITPADTSVNFFEMVNLNLKENIGNQSFNYFTTWQYSNDGNNFHNLYTYEDDSEEIATKIMEKSYLRVIENVDDICYDTTETVIVHLNSMVEGDFFNSTEPVRIFPNPITYYFRLSTYIDIEPTDITVKMVSLEGKVVLEDKIYDAFGVVMKLFYVGDIENGLYIITVTAKDKTVQSKVYKH